MKKIGLPQEQLYIFNIFIYIDFYIDFYICGQIKIYIYILKMLNKRKSMVSVLSQILKFESWTKLYVVSPSSR